jgi:hypothetical protein
LNTILYLTDNSVPAEIGDMCKRILLREAGDIPIVSVSQKPIEFGQNVCVGEIGRSWMSLYKQILVGLDVIHTENVVIAEHDCLYTHEHLSYQPAFPGAFWYNYNHWLVQWHGNHPELDGMYSYWPKRTALSQLVCKGDLLWQSTEEVMRLLDLGLRVEKGLHWYGEPGQTSEQFRKAFVEASSGRSTQLQMYLKDYVTKYQTNYFETFNPNLDIRHSSNFTGPKRGKNRTFDLPPWGKFAEVINGIS